MFQHQIKARNNIHRTKGKLSCKICYNHERPLAYSLEHDECPLCPNQSGSRNAIFN